MTRSLQPRTVTLALRLWFPPNLSGVRRSRLEGPAYAGESGPVTDRFANEKAAGVLEAGSDYTQAIVALVVGAASLLLFSLTREKPYLWFFAYIAILLVTMPFEFAAEHYAWSFNAKVSVQLWTTAAQFTTLGFFLFGILRISGWRVRAAVILVSLGSVVSLQFVLWRILPLPWGNLAFLLFVAAFYGLMLAWIGQAWRRREPDAALLFAALLIDAVMPLLDDFYRVLLSFHLSFAHFFAYANPQLIMEPFPVSLEHVRTLVFLIWLMTVLVLRFGRTSRERQRLATALQAAHDVQYGLVPANLPSSRGFHADIAYLPAEEVGGDFCQILERPDGSVLVVIGDVSGKGLEAAMLGTLAVGALRSLADETLVPGIVLQRLNGVVLRTGYSGFITCLCLVLDRNGTSAIANAGHLAPYLNGVEVAVESGLPLGIVAGVAYEETHLVLPDVTRLTLVSDGVVEARSAHGELFGFERTSRISHLSAAEIATQARRYGQQDDITIVTLDWHAPAAAMMA